MYTFLDRTLTKIYFKNFYKFKIQHATRGINDIEGKNPLKGITDVGLRIEKVIK